MELRVARHTERLNAVVAFYRDGLGLPEIGGFRDHDGYDGVFLSIPGTGAHLELTAGGDRGAALPHPESLLVLYLGDQGAVEAVIARLDAEPLAPANPYWADHGVMVEDPDGFRVVLVPESWAAPRAGVEIAWHDRPRSELRHLFELAEDSRERIDASIDEGRVLVAMDGATAVGYLQLIWSDAPGQAELKSMAVVERLQHHGIGRALVARAVEECRADGVRTIRVGTASADIGNVRFYQRLGFRMLEIERNAFTVAGGYPEEMVIEGIPLRDRVWLVMEL